MIYTIILRIKLSTMFLMYHFLIIIIVFEISLSATISLSPIGIYIMYYNSYYLYLGDISIGELVSKQKYNNK